MPALSVTGLKINAAIKRVILKLQKEFGSFKKLLDSLHPKTKEEWVKILKNTFRFTGSEIVNKFLMSTGYSPRVHIESCPIYEEVLKRKPAFLSDTGYFLSNEKRSTVNEQILKI